MSNLNSNLKKSYVSSIGINTLIQIIGKLVSFGLGLVSLSFLATYLGPAGYGNYSLVFSYMALFSIIADFGVQLTIVRELSHQKDKYSLLESFFHIKAFLVVLSTVLALVFLFFMPYSGALKVAILIGAFAVAISNLYSFGTAVFQADLHISYVTLIDNIVKVVTVGLIVLFVLLKLNFYWIISTVLLGNLVGGGLTLYFLRSKSVFSKTFDLEKTKEILIMSIPVGFSTLFAFMYFKIDTLMLSVLRSSYEVGIYSFAYKFLENATVFWGFYMVSVFPLLSKFKGQGERKIFHNLLKKSVWISLISSFFMVIIGFIASPLIVEILGNGKYESSILPLRILLFALPLLFLNNLMFNLLLVQKKIRVINLALVLASIINITLNMIFIRRDGYIAAAYITIISEASLCALYYVLYFIDRKIRREKE